MADTSDHEEIVRLRDRVHRLEGTVAALNHSQRDMRRGLGELRTTIQETGAELRQAIEGVREDVNGMTHADEIAEAVTAAVRNDRRHTFTAVQKVAGAVLALLVAVPAGRLLVDWLLT